MPLRLQLAASLLAATLTRPAFPAPTLPTAAPPCNASPYDPTHREPNFPSYVDDSFQQLKDAIPALHGLKFEPQQSSDLANSILLKSGELIDTMVPRIPNLIADEQLAQTRVPLPYLVNGVQQQSVAIRSGRGSSMQSYNGTARTVDGEELQKVLQSLLETAHRNTFTYRISATDDPVLGTILDENRVDSDNHPIVLSDGGVGSPQAIGFSSAWLLFRADNLPKSRFRYLGRQKLEGHETAALAFAQIPELISMPAQLGLGEGNTNCSIFFQGIVWIDTNTYQIVRIQTDLLTPIRSIELKRLRSEVHFIPVRIELRNLSLWLPSEAEIVWITRNQAGGELHRYSRYRLFGATSRIIPN